MKTEGTMKRIFTTCFLVLLLTRAARADEPWHCLVGVAGGWASGYDGLLARNGIPHDLLMNQQIYDLNTLKRYDLVVLASPHPSLWAKAVEPLERYVQAGGSLLVDSYYQLSSLGTVPAVEGQVPVLAQYFATNPASKRCTTAFRIVGDNNPLQPDAGAEPYSGVTSVNRVTTDFPNARILAEYTAVSISDDEKKNALPALNQGEPAMVLVPRGKGLYLICGAAFSMGTTLSGTNVDAVVLGAVRLLTHGRGVPQLLPEGFRLSGGSSALSLKLAAHTPAETEGEEVYQPPVREKGPGKLTALPGGCAALTEDRDPEFAVTGTFASNSGEAKILLNYWNDDNYWSLTFKGSQVTLGQKKEGQTAWEKSVTVKGDNPDLAFVAKERFDRICVYLPGDARLRTEGGSLWQGAIGSMGEGLKNLRYQPIGPIYFADDFMRTQDQQGEWVALAGDWRTAPVQNPELGANPFSYRVSSSGADAFAVAGRTYWDNYRYNVAVRPESAAGLVGIMAYVEDDRNFWLFQARINSTPTAYADGFQLIRVTNGNPDILAKAPGALVKGQWYELGLRMSDKFVGAFVDGEKVLSLTDTTFSGGKIGLWLRNAEVRFDDVEVTSSRGAEEAPQVFHGLTPSYAGVIDQDSWAGPANEWRADADTPGLFINRMLLFGDGGLQILGRVLTQNPTAEKTNPSLWLGFLSAGSSKPAPEIAVSARYAEGRLAFYLTRNKAIMRQGSVPISAKDSPVISLRRSGTKFVVRVNDHDELTVTDDSLGDGPYTLAFRVQGARPKISEVSYWNSNIQNETFQTAPVNWWVQRGEWDVTNRWSCSPGWSWFGGYSPLNAQNQYEGVAGVWSKVSFSGDLAVRFYTGPKMLPVPGTKTVLEQMSNFNLTLCGDGKDVRTGYTFSVAPSGEDKARILRQGAVVAETKDFIMPREGHNRWMELTAERVGSRLQLLFDGQQLLNYEDSQPLPGGYVAIWTENNGLLVPRVTVSYTKESGPLLSSLLAPPEAKTGGDADVGKTLDFKENVAGWWSLDNAATISQDTAIFQSAPASLCYKFQPRNGALPVLLSPPLHLAGAKSVSLSLRSSVPDRVVLTLMEEDMSRYIMTVNAPPDKWIEVEIPFSRFTLAGDSADENNRLDPDEINTFTITDMDAVKAMTSDKPFAERKLWVEDVKFTR